MAGKFAGKNVRSGFNGLRRGLFCSSTGANLSNVSDGARRNSDGGLVQNGFSSDATLSLELV